MLQILTIIENPQERLLLRKLLAKASFQILEASSSSAIKNITSKRPDLVMTDVVLPNMDGLELIMRIHQLDPSLPVFALLEHRRKVDQQIADFLECLEVSAIVQKPINPDRVLKTIKSLLIDSARTAG
jgi:CheY-like chemotaxis protein